MELGVTGRRSWQMPRRGRAARWLRSGAARHWALWNSTQARNWIFTWTMVSSTPTALGTTPPQPPLAALVTAHRSTITRVVTPRCCPAIRTRLELHPVAAVMATFATCRKGRLASGTRFIRGRKAVGLQPKAIDNMVFTSFRYYLP